MMSEGSLLGKDMAGIGLRLRVRDSVMTEVRWLAALSISSVELQEGLKESGMFTRWENFVQS